MCAHTSKRDRANRPRAAAQIRWVWICAAVAAAAAVTAVATFVCGMKNHCDGIIAVAIVSAYGKVLNLQNAKQARWLNVHIDNIFYDR